MPPKKDGKKPVVEMDDGTGIPKNYVEFTMKFTIMQLKLENVLFYYEWVNANGETLELLEGGYIEDWTKSDPTANPEERYPVYFTTTFDAVRIDEKFCKTISSKKFQILFVNADDGKVLHQFNLDYSNLLMEEKFQYQHDKNKVLAVENFQFQISIDKPLLTEQFQKQLNPLLINIIGAKQIPVNINKQYLPVYVKYNFFGQQENQSHIMIHGSTLKFSFKHVILLGLMNSVKLKELINSIPFKVEFHDIDEVILDNLKQTEEIIDVQELIKVENERIKQILQEQQDKLLLAQGGKNAKAPPAKPAPAPVKAVPKDDKKGGKKGEKKKDLKGLTLVYEQQPNVNSLNYGIAEFFLTDLLKSNFHETKLRAFIYPNKVFEDKQSKNLDLNTTARKDLQKQHLNTTYLDQGAYIAIQIKLSCEIGSFKPPVVVIKEDPKSKDPKKPQVEVKIENSNPIYERAVFVLPYKSEKFVQQLQNKVNDINLKGMNIQEGGLRQLQTYVLSPAERDNKNLNYIGGFEIMDDEFRVFVLEGNSAQGMKELEEATRILEPNTETFKILRNSEILFKDRIYCDFGLDIKKVRLRDNLRQFLMKPDIYNRIKLPETICNCFIQFNEIRKCTTLKNVVYMNLFPKVEQIISIERKYSDSLSFEDLNGFQDLNAKKSQKMLKTTAQEANSKNQQTLIEPQINFQINIDENAIKEEIPVDATKLTQKDTFNSRKIYSMRCTLFPKTNDNQQIYIYGTQRLNFYEQQKKALREQIQNDPHNFYTYSKDYLSLSIDPYDAAEEIQKIKKENDDLLKSSKRPEFRSISKKKIDVVQKRLHYSQIEEIADNPYVQQKTHTKESLQTKRGLPLSDPNKAEFQNYIKPTQKPFSIPEVIEGEKISSVEKDRIEKEKIKDQRDHFLKKLVGTEFVYTNSVVRLKDSQIDKFKGLRTDEVKKVGFQLKQSQVDSAKIQKDKFLKDFPSSIFIDEKYVQNEVGYILNKVNLPSLNVGEKEFNKYTTENPISKNSIHKVYTGKINEKIK